MLTQIQPASGFDFDDYVNEILQEKIHVRFFKGNVWVGLGIVLFGEQHITIEIHAIGCGFNTLYGTPRYF